MSPKPISPTPSRYPTGNVGRYSTAGAIAVELTAAALPHGCRSDRPRRVDRRPGLRIHPSDAFRLQPKPHRAVRLRKEAGGRRDLERVLAALDGEQVVRAERLHHDHLGLDQPRGGRRLDHDRLGPDTEDELATGEPLH